MERNDMNTTKTPSAEWVQRMISYKAPTVLATAAVLVAAACRVL